MLQFRVLALLAVGATCGLFGCAASDGPDVLRVPSPQYASTFDAAVEAARQHGLPAVLRDRRSGVIETDARTSGSMLEPWRVDNASLGQSVENTVGLQRRRARFEFAPAGFNPELSRFSETNNAESPDTPAPGTGDAAVAPNNPMVSDARDLSQETDDLELRVWVYVERASSPGARRGTWTRHSTTTAQSSGPATSSNAASSTTTQGMNTDATQRGTVWTTVARDTAYERRLLAAIRSMLADRP